LTLTLLNRPISQQNQTHNRLILNYAAAISAFLASLLCLLLSTASYAANAIDTEEELFNESDEHAFQKLLTDKYTDDLFEMIDRGVIRVMVTYSKTHYFIDQGGQHGLTFETVRAFEDYLNKRYKGRRKGKSLSVVLIPAARDELLTKVEQGYADIAIANLTITPERKKQVNFSIPSVKHISEVIVASKSATPLKTLDDISGKTFFVRKSSSFYQHLQAHNQTLEAKELAPANIIEADEHLEVEDLMEMANADLISYTIVDSHIAKLWEKVFDQIVVYDDLTINTGGQIAWGVRKNTPNLTFEINRFLKKHRAGTTFGNVLRKRYLDSTYWAQKALAEDDKQRFNQVVDIFKNYAELYDFNHLMLLAQGYQESRLDHSRKSHVGAVGIMQIMPDTGKAMEVGDIAQLENNVHAGSKYLRKIIDHYFDDPEIDELNKILFSFAAYNAGPTRIKRLRRKTAKLGLDPNVWFGNVEHTVARYVGRETVTYVANISKYYIAYRLIEEQSRLRAQAVKSTVSE
jgi:membrane-bound lytic murein transglycosylase MltF